MLDSARVLRTTSPRGVAPPVSDDCAPIGSTFVACATSDATSASLRGNATPAANPPGTCAASLRNDDRSASSVWMRGAGTGCAFRALMRCPNGNSRLHSYPRPNRRPRAHMDPIRYTLSFTAPHTHYVEVRAEVPTSGRREVEL